MDMQELWEKINAEFKKSREVAAKDRESNAKWFKQVEGIKLNQQNLEKKVIANEKSLAVTKMSVVDLQCTVAQLEQERFNNNLVIRGVPEQDGEKVREVVAELIKNVNDTIRYKVVNAHRLGYKSTAKDRPILVKFASAEQKSQILREKKKKQINCSEVTVNGTKLGSNKNTVYFGEHLAPINAKLAYIARKLVKKNELAQSWTSNGKVFVRKSGANETPIMIRHESHFVAILNEVTSGVSAQVPTLDDDVVNVDEDYDENAALSEPENSSMKVLKDVIKSTKKTSMKATTLRPRNTKPAAAINTK